MRCVCGNPMRRVSQHLNFEVWKCCRCGRKETWWKGANPWMAGLRETKNPPRNGVEKDFPLYLSQIIEEALEKELGGVLE